MPLLNVDDTSPLSGWYLLNFGCKGRGIMCQKGYKDFNYCIKDDTILLLQQKKSKLEMILRLGFLAI